MIQHSVYHVVVTIFLVHQENDDVLERFCNCNYNLLDMFWPTGVFFRMRLQGLVAKPNCVKTCDLFWGQFLQILPEDTKTELKEAAVISMGTEVCDLDLIKYQRPL